MSKVVLMVGTAKGGFLFSSDEKRERWEMEGPSFKGWEVFDLQLDRRREPILYAATCHSIHGYAAHVSHDLGGNWRQLPSLPVYQDSDDKQVNRIWKIVPGHAEEPEVLFAGVEEAGLFVSRDSGSSWVEVEDLNDHSTRDAWVHTHGGLCCHTVLIDPKNKARMWVAISAAGVLRTDDGGLTWEIKNQGLPLTAPSEKYEDLANCVHSLWVSPERPDVLYQQNHGGMFRSTNGGDAWHRIEDGLPSNFGLPMAMHPGDSRRLYAAPIMEGQFCHLPIGGRLFVARTRDGGDTWTACSNGLPQEHFYGNILRNGLAVDGLDDCGVYLGTTGGDIFYSRDDAESWQKLPGYSALPRVLTLSAIVLD